MATVVSGNTEISIIQGDSYQKSIEITNVDTELIESIVFSCKALNLTRELTKSLIGNKYELYFTSTETAAFSVLNSNYDLTVKFNDGKIKTIIYNSFIEVLPKNNTLGEDKDIIVEKEVTITENGKQEIVADENKAFSKVTVNVNVAATGAGKLPQVIDGSVTELTADDLAGATAIRSYMFYDCNNLISVVIPEGVTIIYDNAFMMCDKLESITIPSTLIESKANTFTNDTALKAVYISDLEAWNNIHHNSTASNPLNYANNLYLNGELVTNLVIPNGVTIINRYTFPNAKCIKSITIPKTVTLIDTLAFQGCGAESVTFEDNSTLQELGNSVFNDCNSLTSITIPASVIEIGMSSLKIGSSTNKATITMLSTTPPTMQISAFDSSKLNQIIVPAGTGEAYRSATNWSRFADYIVEATA